jgi:hypothetical protein
MALVLVAAAMLAQGTPPMRVHPDGKVEERPVYRTLQPGEQRAEGLLRRINCPGRGPVTFVVKQKDNVVQYTAPQLTSVDFIVYRKDFHGPVTCQGFGGGEPVYVTYKPEGKTPRVIAIEFLPPG